jgi:hypothetical protein
LIYSTAGIFNWKKAETQTMLVLYGGEDELHEVSHPVHVRLQLEVQGDGVVAKKVGRAIVEEWLFEPSRRVVTFGESLEVALLWRNEGYNYWVWDLPAPENQGLNLSLCRENDSVRGDR